LRELEVIEPLKLAAPLKHPIFLYFFRYYLRAVHQIQEAIYLQTSIANICCLIKKTTTVLRKVKHFFVIYLLLQFPTLLLLMQFESSAYRCTLALYACNTR
jgi:hypothetical protein